MSLSKHAFSFPCQISFTALKTLITKLMHHHHLYLLFAHHLENLLAKQLKPQERHVYEKGKKHDFKNIAAFSEHVPLQFFVPLILYSL